MPATVELSVPPLRKQAGGPAPSWRRTARRSSSRNSSRRTSRRTPDSGRKLGTQYGRTSSTPFSKAAQWPGGKRYTPWKIVRGDGMT
jgi:hypothetical protein